MTITKMRVAKVLAKASPTIPHPQTQATVRRNALRLNRSAVHPKEAIATIEDAAPASNATPKGPGERSRARLRSAKSIVWQPTCRPNTQKAQISNASTLPPRLI